MAKRKVSVSRLTFNVPTTAVFYLLLTFMGHVIQKCCHTFSGDIDEHAD